MSDEREELRRTCWELLQRLRDEPTVPGALFDLLNALLLRCDRLELGRFAEAPDEEPTVPEKRISTTMPRVTSQR